MTEPGNSAKEEAYIIHATNGHVNDQTYTKIADQIRARKGWGIGMRQEQLLRLLNSRYTEALTSQRAELFFDGEADCVVEQFREAVRRSDKAGAHANYTLMEHGHSYMLYSIKATDRVTDKLLYDTAAEFRRVLGENPRRLSAVEFHEQYGLAREEARWQQPEFNGLRDAIRNTKM